MFLYNYIYVKKNTIKNKNLLGIKFIHSSKINYATNDPSIVSQMINAQMNQQNVVNNMQVVPFGENPSREEILDSMSDCSISDMATVFPWFLDENGKIIDFNKSIKLFNGIKIISIYLEKKLGMDTTLIPEGKLSELIEPFLKDEKISVLELLNHIRKKINSDKDFLNSLSENLNSYSSTVSENVVDPNSNINSPKALSDYTLGETYSYIKNLNWKFMLNNTEITLNTIPMAVNLFSYGLVMRCYMKLVYNRPYPVGISAVERMKLNAIRERKLAIFAFLGAPVVIVILRNSAISFKDLSTINLPFGSSTESELLTENKNTKSINSSISFLFLNNIYKKIPNWLKLFFKLILLSVLVLKLLGINSFVGFFNNLFYIKLFCYFSCSLAILYQILNIYLIYKFSKPETKISEIFPEFIIKWLKEFEVLGKKKETLKYFKDTCYREIIVYIFIILIITVLL